MIMASIHFYLEKRRDVNGHIRKTNVPILLYFSFEGKRLQLNTGERIDFADWDFRKQQALEGGRGAKQLNRYLRSLSEEILNIYREAKTVGLNPGLDFIRQQLKYRRRKDNVRFFDIYMRFIDQNYPHWSLHTFRKIKTTYNHLVEFANADGADIEFNRIDNEFLDRYVRFFKIRYGHSNNTIGKNLDILKWFLNWATDRGYNKSMMYKDYRFNWAQKPRIEQADLVLNWDELMKLQQYEPVTGTLTDIRDMFCFMCFTGMRLSRIHEIMSEDLFPSYIRIKEKGSFHNMPISDRAFGIARIHRERSRADGRCFPYFRHPDFNRFLKQVGKEAGINNFVKLKIYSGEEVGTRQVQKFEILSSKVAVNTFIFHALRLGISAEVLSFITGSKTMYGVERIRPLIKQVAHDEIQKFNTLTTGIEHRSAAS
jgi:hypothetical protein